METKHPIYAGAAFHWDGVLGWAEASSLGVAPGSTPHTSLPRKGVAVTGFWVRSPKSGKAMFFRLQEAITTSYLKSGNWSDAEVTCWLYVSDRGIKLTVYND